MVLIAALWALPFKVIVHNNLPVETAHMAIIGFCVKLRILDVIVNKLDNFLQRLQIVAHIGDFHIGNGASRGYLLELALKFKFMEGINLFSDIHMV